MKDTRTSQSQALMAQNFFFEELYPLLKEHDHRDMLELSEDKDAMKVTFDQSFSIDIYDNAFLNEVYVAFVFDGKQQTHWHIEYEDAYAELMDCIENPQVYIDKFLEAKQKLRRRTQICFLVCGILVVVCIMLVWSGILG